MNADLRPLKLTYEDYLHFPEDGRRHEIIDGEDFLVPAPNLRHQAVIGKLYLILGTFLAKHPVGQLWLSPVDVVLSNVDVVQPDLVFVSQARQDIHAETHLRGAPSLAVEVLSPWSRRRDAITKHRLYERSQIEEYWIVDPELATVEVFRLQEGGLHREAQLSGEKKDTLSSPLFPGLKIALRKLFE